MATKTTILLIDDLDGKSEASETVTWGLDGTQYEMDLTAAHAAALRKSLAKYVEVSRKVTSPKVTKRPKLRSVPQYTTEEIRTWAKEQGIDIKERGRIPAEIIDQHHAAMKQPRATIGVSA